MVAVSMTGRVPDLAAVAQAAAANGLEVMGAFHTAPGDSAPDGVATVVMLGPAGAQFWHVFRASREARDGRGDPIDRWSARVIAGLADDLGAVPLFPFGEPRQPFVSWAVRTGRAWLSPAMMMVHDRQGLWMSFRGALGFAGRLDLGRAGAPASSPCEACSGRPCLSACPAGAVTAAGYDIDACHAFLDSAPGQVCMTRGCRVRAACPVSQRFSRPDAQSAHHMRYFHPGR